MYRCLAESIVGTRHRAAGAVNQDAVHFVHTVRADGERYLVAAVADGAGSAALGEVGAHVATAAVVDAACRRLEDNAPFTSDDLQACVAHAHAAVIAEAERRTASARDLACTMLVAVVGAQHGHFGQIGDGAIVSGGGDRGERVLPGDSGDYANITYFLSSSSWREHLRLIERRSPEWFALVTDGIELMSIDPRSDVPVEGFFTPFVRAIRAAEDVSDLVIPLREFLDSPRLNARTDDDKTMLVAVRS